MTELSYFIPSLTFSNVQRNSLVLCIVLHTPTSSKWQLQHKEFKLVPWLGIPLSFLLLVQIMDAHSSFSPSALTLFIVLFWKYFVNIETDQWDERGRGIERRGCKTQPPHPRAVLIARECREHDVEPTGPKWRQAGYNLVRTEERW